MPLLLIILALSSYLCGLLASTCTRIPKLTLMPSTKYGFPPCLRESYFFDASAYRVFNTSGLCELHYPCSAGNFALDPDKACTAYRELKVGEEILLLRTVTSGNNDPYLDLLSGPLNPVQLEAKNLTSQTAMYKSPAFAWPSDFWEDVRFQLLAGDFTTVHVNLLFRHEAGEDIQKGLWFAKDRLKAAYPWSVSVMRAATFVTFSAVGFTLNLSPTPYRRFNIEKFRDVCETVTGYLKVTIAPNSACTHDNYAQVGYSSTVSDTGGANAWHKGFKKSEELRISGVISSTDRIFVKGV